MTNGGSDTPMDDFRPVGTIAVTIAFTVMLVLMWSTVYIILLSRGATG